jgi:hypothetical protein
MKLIGLVFLGVCSYLIYVCDRIICAVTFKRMPGFEEWGNSVFTQYGMPAEFMHIRASFMRVFSAILITVTLTMLPYWIIGILISLFVVYVIILTIKSKRK